MDDRLHCRKPDQCRLDRSVPVACLVLASVAEGTEDCYGTLEDGVWTNDTSQSRITYDVADSAAMQGAGVVETDRSVGVEEVQSLFRYPESPSIPRLM